MLGYHNKHVIEGGMCKFGYYNFDLRDLFFVCGGDTHAMAYCGVQGRTWGAWLIASLLPPRGIRGLNSGQQS